MRKGFISKLISVCIISAISFTTFLPQSLISVQAATKADYGVGQGRKIPDQIFAPYLDLCDYWKEEGYHASGAPYMPKLSQDTGIKYFNLAFIQAAGKTVTDGKVKWAWAGLSELSEGSNSEQYLGMKKSIKDFREMGGEVIISFGGRDGVALWQATDDVDVLTNTYKEIVEGYSCTRIDLDIEGGAQGVEDNRVNAKAMKKLQDETGVEVTLTLPVLPSGLTKTQTDVLEVYLTEGVDVEMVNIMAMCYGPNALEDGENYGSGSVRAIDSTMKQIKEYYKKYLGVFLTDAEAYKKVGVTTSVGFESNYDPLFPPEWTKLVTDHAIDKEIGMNSFWSINRDSKQQENQGITNAYEHTEVAKKFADPNHNFIPTFNGLNTRKVQVGTSFDPLKGVKAIDREDGDITSKIKISGTVNTNIPGDYTLEYSVEDSKGGKAVEKRIITVTRDEVINSLPVFSGTEDKDLIIGVPFDLLGGVSAIDDEDGDITSSIKVEGTVDTNKLGSYLIIYTVTDSDGGQTRIPMVVNVINAEDYIEQFDYYKVYDGGEIVWYNGEKYKCKYWSTYEYPDVSYAWEKLPGEVIDVETLSKAAVKYNCKIGDNLYDVNYDWTRDGIIDIFDLTSIAKKIQ